MFCFFYPDFCIFQDLFNGKVKGIGKQEGRLYVLKGGGWTRGANHSRSEANSFITEVFTSSCILWYQRLGHHDVHVLKYLDIMKNPSDANMLNKCSVCPLAKQTRL